MPRFFRTTSLIICMFFVISTLLSGCSQEGGLFIGGQNEKSTRAITSKDISIPIEKIRTLNPAITKDEDAYHICQLVYEGLVKLDNTLIAVPALAESWQYTSDKNAIIFHLRDDVLWHDGTKFTAEDVKFSIDVFLKASTTLSTLYAEQMRCIKTSRVMSENEIEITFANTSSLAVENFTFPILPKKQFKSVQDALIQKVGFLPIGTGPYCVSVFDEVNQIILTSNLNYYGEQKPDNQLIFKVLPSRTDAVNLFAIDRISLSISKETDRGTLYNNKEVIMVPFVSNEVEVLGFNCTNPLLMSPKVRQAISSVIDKQEIIEMAYYHSGIEQDSLYYPDYLEEQDQQQITEIDIEKAELLLSEAGFINRDADFVVEDVNGNELTLEILVNKEDRSRNLAALIIKNGLDKLPVHSVIMVEDWSVYQSRIASDNYDIFVGGWTINPVYDLRALLHSNYDNPVNYRNISLDLMLDKMQSGITGREKQETLQKIETILKEELPYDCLLYKTYSVVCSDALQGESDPQFFSFYLGAEKWSNSYEAPKEN